MISIKEVAEKAGVSVPTAYKVYDENYNTTEDVKQRVLCAARELNYVHKSKQKKKGAEEGKIVAIVYNEQTNSFNNYITQALSNELERFGHRLVVLHDDETIDQAEKNVKLIQDMGVDAMVFTPVSEEPQEAICRLIKSGFPLVQLFNTVYPELDTILFNDELGTYLATNYLLKSGHRKIMLASRTSRSEYIRRPGYCRAFEEMGLQVDDRFLFTLNYVNSVKQMVKEKILKERPTAIIAVSETMCATVILALRELNLSVPEDVSLVSYDNYPWMEAYNITAISHPIDKVGSIVARLLLDSFKERTAGTALSPSKFMIDPSLILRDSVNFLHNT
ncbi:MAG: LacI family transcriptional regulator [Lachnospiraceae bacterium]|jgi:DNA-binding LacI/PurR family transcriptional regulator|nr:LacI family transcriptional regulator [Lachnospiraceae bacterium]